MSAGATRSATQPAAGPRIETLRRIAPRQPGTISTSGAASPALTTPPARTNQDRWPTTTPSRRPRPTGATPPCWPRPSSRRSDPHRSRRRPTLQGCPSSRNTRVARRFYDHTPSTRLVSMREGAGWSLFRFRARFVTHTGRRLDPARRAHHEVDLPEGDAAQGRRARCEDQRGGEQVAANRNKKTDPGPEGRKSRRKGGKRSFGAAVRTV